MDHPRAPSASEQAASAARAIEHQGQVELAAAAARTPEEWVDIYQSVIEFAVKSTLEASKMGHEVLERLAEPRAALKQIRHKFQSHGLPLSESLEFEGPELHIDEKTGHDIGITWPQGRWVRFHWPDKSSLEFRGYTAFVAIMFIRWWSQFAMLHQQQAAALAGTTPAAPSRLIEPGSPEWDRYYSAKHADMEKQRQGRQDERGRDLPGGGRIITP
jgi:hypothetical protein